VSEEPDEAAIKRRSGNAEGAMSTVGGIGIDAIGCALPVIATAMLPLWAMLN
jgi:hypothetical protein